jgi:pyruvate formate lyase activating enzyme
MTKGLIFDIKRYALHDGPGIRTTVFLKGCAANCWWCHNPESQALGIEKSIRINRFDQSTIEEEEIIGRKMSVDELMIEICKDQVFYDESGGGVTFSGGEPLMQPKFLREILKRCNESGLRTTLDTTGSAPEDVFKSIIDFVDLFLYDIKFIDDRLHQKYAGVSNLNILRNLQTLVKQKRAVALRFPVIPGITDQEKNIEEILQFVLNLNQGDMQIDLLPYHKIARHKYEKLNKDYLMGKTQVPTSGHMDSLKKKFERAGLQVTIGG